ncbi:MAG: glycosyltransferase family 2 protein [bacterium]
MKISVIIVSFNSSSVLKRCLDALTAQEGDPLDLEIIVVDNHSVDSSRTVAQSFSPKLKLIANEENHGFAKACNQGARAATGEYILFLNPDVELQQETVAGLVKALISEEASIAAPALRDAGGKISPTIYKIPNLWLLVLKTILPYSGYLPLITHRSDYQCTAPSVTAACMLIRRTDFAALSGFDERFFLYFEDIDLCYRASQAGLTILFVPSAVATHTTGHSSWQDMATFFLNFARSEQLFFQKHSSRFIARTATLLIRCGMAVRISSMSVLAVLFREKKLQQRSEAYARALQQFKYSPFRSQTFTTHDT